MTTNRGRWWARHINLRLHDRPCEPDCPVCHELQGYQADYSTPPPETLATELATGRPIAVRQTMPKRLARPTGKDPWGNPLG